jgi:CubicO group peptidase (beta-lactamase class C family)
MLLVCFVSRGQDQKISFERARAEIQKQLTERNVSSIAIAVVRDGRILWEEGFGWADKENRVPATENTMFSLASLSKPITATALMILVERRTIDLDRPINDYLGEAKLRARVGNARDATVRRVANHSSGLPAHWQYFFVDEPSKPPPMDETIRRYGNLITPPAERYSYSNLGYAVIGYVIAHVSKRSFADFLRDEVFPPLGMSHTTVGIEPNLKNYYAVRYGVKDEPLPFYVTDTPGSSAVFASAHDLALFAMFHLKSGVPDQKPILTNQSIDEMQQPTSQESESAGYGIGWSVVKAGTDKHVQHGGEMPGVLTSLYMIPSKRIAIVLLSNSANAKINAIGKEVLTVLAPEIFQSQSGSPLASSPKTVKAFDRASGVWRGNVYTYRGKVRLILTFLPSGEVRARLGQESETQIQDPNFKDGYLSGQMMGNLRTEDVNRRLYNLNFSLKLRGEVLNGVVTAISVGGRGGYGLSHWVELRKQ